MPPQPTITDIHSWFGLVNQVAPFIAPAPINGNPIRGMQARRYSEMKTCRAYLKLGHTAGPNLNFDHKVGLTITQFITEM